MDNGNFVKVFVIVLELLILDRIIDIKMLSLLLFILLIIFSKIKYMKFILCS